MTNNLTRREEDIQRLLVSNAHLGGKSCTKQMTKYVWERRSIGVHLFDVVKQYEKIQAAARIIASIPDPRTIIVFNE